MNSDEDWEWAADPEGYPWYPQHGPHGQFAGWFQLSGCPELIALEFYVLSDTERENGQ